MKLKKILTTVLTLCFVVTALAGIANARDIGSWTTTLKAQTYFTGTNGRIKYSKGTNAVINVQNSGTTPGYIYDFGNNPASANWRVIFPNTDTSYNPATKWVNVKNNERRVASYYAAYDSYVNRAFKLQLYNYNSFIIRTRGTWSPDQN